MPYFRLPTVRKVSHGQGIEAIGKSLLSAFSEIRFGDTFKAAKFSRSNGFFRESVIIVGRNGARLYLHEDELFAVIGDDVDLSEGTAAVVPIIPLQDRKAGTLQETDSRILPLTSEDILQVEPSFEEGHISLSYHFGNKKTP